MRKMKYVENFDSLENALSNMNYIKPFNIYIGVPGDEKEDSFLDKRVVVSDYAFSILIDPDFYCQYKNDIEILLGLEVEYLYTLWEPLLELIEPYPIEYMILGQHYLGNGVNEPFCGEPSRSAERLRQYCRQTREALETGKFLYFAHPDVLWYTGPGEIYEEEMTKLCRFCKEIDIPLEINLLGVREDRSYPCEQFWKIAAREGNSVIYGSDAHHAEHVYSEEVIAKADRFIEKCGIPRERVIEVM